MVVQRRFYLLSSAVMVAALLVLTRRFHAVLLSALEAVLPTFLLVLIPITTVFVVLLRYSSRVQRLVLNRFRSQRESEEQPWNRSSWYVRNGLREEARMTIREQVEWVEGIDSKATQTLRFNILILGASVPALSFAFQQGVISSVEAIDDPFIIAGTVSFVLSSAFAAVTYTSSSLEIGISSDSVADVHAEDYPSDEFHNELMQGYASWIQANRKAIELNSNLISLTVLLLVYGIVFYVLGITAVLFDPVETIELIGACLLIVITTVVSSVY